MENEELNGDKLLDRLRLENVAGKRNLIEDLKKRKSQRSMSLLVEMLQDESWYLREQAVKALSEAGSEAREPVSALLENGLWYTRAAAAKVLGEIGGEDEVGRLVDCLTDSNMTVQGAAAAALVQISKASSVEGLARALASRPPQVKHRALSCLRLLDRELASSIEDFWERQVAGRGRGAPSTPGPNEGS